MGRQEADVTGWIILGLYVLGYVLTWRTVTWAIANEFAFGGLDGADVVFGVFLGTVATLAWPAIAGGLGVRRLYRGRGESALVVLMPRSVRRDRLAAEQAKRIQALERELGLSEELDEFPGWLAAKAKALATEQAIRRRGVS